jgi:MYXO-CTERM domain-containing protein
MMRDANAAGSNTYHGSFGTVGAWMSTEMVFEWKNTVSSASQLGWAPNTSGTGQIRLCRVGSQVRTMFRPDSASAWTVGNEQTRNDFGNELEVGPIAFSLNNPANFRAVFEFVDYATITSMTECEGVPVSYLELEGDGGAGDLAAADPAGGDDTAANAGCGCSADDEGHGGGFAFAILFGLLGLQRRRRTLG